MRREMAVYAALLVLALLFQYTVELRWSGRLALSPTTLLPWVVSAAAYAAVGAAGWFGLKRLSAGARLGLLGFVPVVSHVAFELTHGSDPAYPHIGLVFIIPDLLFVGLGTGIAAAISRRRGSLADGASRS